MRIVMTRGAMIRTGKTQFYSKEDPDYGNWGPGGAMEAGESIEETMKRV